MYGILRWIASVSLHWFYGDIRVIGEERIPRRAPLLIAVNHTNALVDSLIIGWLMPRRVVMTAKATLMNNPLIAVLFRVLGVVPLRRAVDERKDGGGNSPNPARNSGAFREMLAVLKRNGAVLIFPEGTSHGSAQLAPLRSGLARVALQAREMNIKSLQILPVGLLFENKATPGSRVSVQVGEPIVVDDWPINSNHASLTAELTHRLRAVSERRLISSEHPAESPIVGRLKRAGIRLAAAWGRVTHEVPIRIARRVAVRISTDADQPAMFTIVIGLALVLATYTLCLAVVGLLTHSLWMALISLAMLLVGAHWAAFEPHHQR
jgi:1-acyl-sn-glycerol-3-phosphate acyltransferase